MRITKKEYEEYQALKKLAIRKSAKTIKRLEDDIDFPIKNCVGMFALLGCKPLYSCCGFDYEGQPFHKAHQYGEPYVKIGTTTNSLSFISNISAVASNWQARTGRGFIDVFVKITAENGNSHWRKPDCIHFSEECLFAIQWMEQFLWNAKNYMADEILLEDTNALAKKSIPYWQYPPKKPWRILKSEIAKSMKSN